jgi:molybdopterin-guanine dinucleotide biosynthesis protein A
MLGLYSALKELKILHYEKALVLSCDNPLIQPQVIKTIIQECSKFDCCIPKWSNGFLEPLFAVYPVSMAFETAKKSLLQNKLKLTNILDEKWNINYISVEESIRSIDPDLLSFKNLNEIEQIKELKKILNKF